MGGKPARMGRLLALRQGVFWSLLATVDSVRRNRRYFYFDDGFDGHFNSGFCFNSRYNSHTSASKCEESCCSGDNCGSETECRVATIVGSVIGVAILVCCCGGLLWCFLRKRLCFSHHGHCHDENVVIMEPAWQHQASVVAPVQPSHFEPPPAYGSDYGTVVAGQASIHTAHKDINGEQA